MAIRSPFRFRLGLTAGLACVLIATTAVVLWGGYARSAATTLSTALSATFSETNSTYTMQPITGTNGATPLVMLNLSRDHQLHYKAYNDYSVLDSKNHPGVVQTTYAGYINYYGYFDYTKCYTYDTTNNYFVPAELATAGTDASGNAVMYCNQGSTTNEWSGNFLNWGTMTRMDSVRKLLYGGKRYIDTSSLTVLERDFLPMDAHAFAKYYGGADIAKLAPFSNTNSTPVTYTTTQPGALLSTTPDPTVLPAPYNVQTINAASCVGSGTCTFQTTGNHGYVVGEYVAFQNNCAGAQVNMVAKITAIPTTKKFSFTYPTTVPIACATDSGTVELVIPVTPTATAPITLGDQIRVSASATNYLQFVLTTLLDANYNSLGSASSGTVYMRFDAATVDSSNLSVSSGASAGNFTALSITNLDSTGISFCNITRGDTSGNAPNGLSQSNTNPPLVKVARGNYTLWGANESVQCNWAEERNNQQSGFGGGLRSNGNRAAQSGLNAAAENPLEAVHGLGSGSAVGEYNVRVQACVVGLEGAERCELYPNKNEKPIGLLQVYGETGRINFGLITPTYEKNISGGVVRKNISSFAAEVNSGSDGTFTGTSGIVSNVNNLKTYGYSYNNAYVSADNCTYQLTGLVLSGGSNTQGQPQNQGNCVSWGNPIGESYSEALRYFAGLTPTPAFSQDTSSPDSTLGLTVVSSWTDPLSSSNYCAALNVLTFNASVSSYDNDQFNITGLQGSPNAVTQTNTVGDDEGITGNKWFIGAASGASNGYCDAKTIATLGTASGICPESPTLQGSYLMAGAAYYAHTHQIRNPTPLLVPSADTTSLKVASYGIQLATNTPKIVIPVPGSTSTVTILPIYRLNLGAGGSGTLVDFKLVSQDIAGGTGKFYVNWEDSAQGGDYDQDEWGTITYAISGNNITVTTDAISASTNNGQGFGYIINGTNKDGPHFHSGIYGFSYTDPVNINVYDANNGTLLNGTTPYTNSSDAGGVGGINASGGCNNCALSNPPTQVTYTISGTQAGVLQDPLFYMAKYGGYNTTLAAANGDGYPAKTAEWDAQGQDGSTGSDGYPDNYFFVTNPGALETALATAFNSIIDKTSSGTAAAVVANQREGDGATYQAVFETTRSDSNSKTATWLGALQALFIDQNGNLREDTTGHTAVLNETDFTANPAIAVYYDAPSHSTLFSRYNCDPTLTTPACTASATALSLDKINTLWNARDTLAALTTAQVTSNRAYTDKAETGRYIFTFIDQNLDGAVASSEVVPFTLASFQGSTSNTYGMLNVGDATSAQTIINYVRGIDSTGLRNRTIDYKNSGTSLTYRLGDIVDSTPTVVGTPAEAFDLLYNDTTYATFRKQYQYRRNVIYVGADDGMLHAFNGGFYNANNTKFQLTPLDGSTVTQHALGSELWAYVPFNLLPHLIWLTSPSYAHVFYVDGTPRVFDARIFAADTDHPGGWGTVMVTGFRFGGGDLELPASNCTNSAAFGGFTPTGTSSTKSCTSPSATIPKKDIYTHSAYVVMDITNPEKAPTLLAELGTDPTNTTADFGFTTSYPTVAAFSSTGGSTTDSWYLAFGNGPTDLATASTASNSNLYIYKMTSSGFSTAAGTPLSLGVSGGFTGDPVSVDWNLDFKADALYVGTAKGLPANPSGTLVRINTQSAADTTKWTVGTLVNPGDPILETPSVAQDQQGRHWVFAGSGRLYVGGDKVNAVPGQELLGVIDDGSTARSYSTLLDVTSAKANTTTQKVNVSGTDYSESSLETLVQGDFGWKILLNTPASTTTTTSAERITTTTALVGNTLFATPFTPDTSQCAGEGSSRLFGVNFITGAANPSLAALGTYTDSSSGTTYTYAYNSVPLGQGLAAAPSLHMDTSGGSGTTGALSVITQSSTGAINVNQANVAAGATNSEIDWRLTHPGTGP